MKTPLTAIALASVSVLALAGCASTAAPEESDAGLIQVTASTSVYGSLAEQIGGDRVEVTSIITSSSQDPHSYEASARDRLSIRNADLVIENGGGYDAFVDSLLDGSAAHVLTAVEYSHDFPGNEGHDAEDGDNADAPHDHEHSDDAGDAEHDHADHDHIDGFNEHVWFDPHTMIRVVEGIAAELSELDPAGEADFTAASDEIIAELEGIEADLEALSAESGGQAVFITEPLPGYIAAAAGLTDVTPDGFAAAVEEGSDVAPATLLDALEVIENGEVQVLLTNAQTGGAESERVEAAATAAGIPIVAFTELPEEGSSYAEWMRAAIQDLADALES